MKIKKIVLCVFFCFILSVVSMIADIYSMQSEKINKLKENIHNIETELELLKNPTDGVKYHGQLKVSGTNLVDCHDNIFQLRGVSSHGILWYPEYSNYRAINTIKQYGANVFRIAMYTEPSKGYVNLPEESIDSVLMAIENALGADMYVIVDWHILKDNDPNMYINEAAEFFEKISSKYAGNPGIIYEICNEPNGDTSWQDIVKYSNKIIPIIRNNSPEAIILVGTPKYCTSLSEAIGTPLNFANVMYSFHYYTEIGKDNYINTLNNAINKIPIFVSEWGINDGGEKLANEFIRYLNVNNISWVNWALANKAESYSLLKSSCTHLSDWDETCFTKQGQLIFNNLKGN